MELETYRTMAATEDQHWWYCGRRAIAETVIRGLDLPRDAKIVEIGAGTGGNIAMLEQFGAVQAVEMSDLARQIARTKTGRDFLSGYLPDNIPVAAGSVDLICLFDVLEHVAEDEASLKAMRHLLKPGGKIVLTVPAHQWLWSEHDVGAHHMRRYSQALLRTRIEKAGYRVGKLTYTNAALFPAAILARLADRLRRPARPSGQTMPPKPVNAAMKALFSAESLIVAKASLPFGLSLLAVLSNDGARRRSRRSQPNWPPEPEAMRVMNAGLRLLERAWSMRLSRFALIGIVATAIYAVLAFAFTRMDGLGATGASVLAFALAAMFSYAGHKYVTFASGGAHRLELPRFLVLCTSGLAVAIALPGLLTDLLGMPAAVPIVLTCLIVPVVNYAVLGRWVFRNA